VIKLVAEMILKLKGLIIGNKSMWTTKAKQIPEITSTTENIS
jgi:hypothetical protein